MTGFINKTIGVFLAFVLLVIAPLSINTLVTDLTMRRSVLNAMANLIATVDDSAQLTDEEKADFYLECSSYGADLDMNISRRVKLVLPKGTGETYTTYTTSTDIATWNPGDKIIVGVNAVNYTGPQLLVQQLIGFVEKKFDTQLEGMIRS